MSDVYLDNFDNDTVVYICRIWMVRHIGLGGGICRYDRIRFYPRHVETSVPQVEKKKSETEEEGEEEKEEDVRCKKAKKNLLYLGFRSVWITFSRSRMQFFCILFA